MVANFGRRAVHEHRLVRVRDRPEPDHAARQAASSADGFAVGQVITTSSAHEPGAVHDHGRDVADTAHRDRNGDGRSCGHHHDHGSGHHRNDHVYEYNGVLASSDPFDGSASTFGTGTSASSGTVAPISGATDDLLIAGLSANGGASNPLLSTQTNGFTNSAPAQVTASLNVGGATNWNRRTVSDQQRFARTARAMTISPSSPWRGQIVAFKAKVTPAVDGRRVAAVALDVHRGSHDHRDGPG